MTEAHGIEGDAIAGRVVVVAVTRDHAEVWGLEPRSNDPLVRVLRDDELQDHRHVRPAQNAHGHDSDKGFDRFFEDLATMLVSASEVMLVGHGKGRANAMENFAEFLQSRHPSLYAKVTELRYGDVTRMNGRQLAALAREWKKEQFVRGRRTD